MDVCVFNIFLSQLLHKQLPFAGCHIALQGFSDDEAQHMIEIATDNGILTSQ